jgi:hypothetical protein
MLDRRSFLKTLAAALALGTQSFVQGTDATVSPEDAARASFRLFKEWKTGLFARTLSQKHLDRFKTSLLDLMHEAEQSGNADAALAALGWQDRETLGRATPTDLLEHLLVSLQRECPELTAIMEQAELQILGVIEESKAVAHVPYYLLLDGQIAGMQIHPQLLTLDKCSFGWSLRLKTDGASFAELSERHNNLVPDLSIAYLGHLFDAEKVAFVVHRQRYGFGRDELLSVQVRRTGPQDALYPLLLTGKFRKLENELAQTIHANLKENMEFRKAMQMAMRHVEEQQAQNPRA